MSEKFFKVKSGITTANIVFNNKTVNSNLQVSYLQSNVLSFSGTSGQLFSIADTMTGTIFAVNDISGVPSIEVYDTGDVRLAETFGNVLVGSATNPNGVKFYVNGAVGITGAINANGSVGTSGQVLTSNANGIFWSTLANTNAVQSNLTTLTTSVNTIKANVDSVASNVANILTGTTTFTGSKTFSGNLIVTAISAGNSYGSPGQVLTSNSSGTYWSTVSSGSGLSASSYVVRAVKNGSTQTVPANTDTIITFIDDFDPQGWWTPNKFQPTIAGYYTISTQIWWGAGTINNNQTNLQLRKNGSVQLAIAQTPVNNSTVGEFLSISTIAYFNGTSDYVEVSAYSSNPTSQDINGSASGTWFAAALLAAGWSESSINNVQSNVTTLTASVNTIKANVDSVQSNVSTLTTSVNTIKANVDSVSSNVSNILTGTTTFSGTKTFTGNILVTAISANGSFGSSGQVLTSNSAGTYWATPATSVRAVSITDATSITVNADITDLAHQNNTQTAGTLTINAPTGTPTNGQKFILRITCTNVQTLSCNAAFIGSTDLALPTATTGSSKTDYLGFIYSTGTSKWHLLAKNFGF